jgi:hypothetical protein
MSRKELTRNRRGSAISSTPPDSTPLGPTSVANVFPNISTAGKKPKRSASVLQETPFVDQRESPDDASIASDESMEDGLRVEIEKLHKMLEAVHARVYEQGIIIEQQKQEIETLKAVHNDHEVKINHIMACPPSTAQTIQAPSYKDALKVGIPQITSTIIKEQSERQKRTKNIIIKDKRHPDDSLIKPATDPTTAVNAWLLSHGLSPQETKNASIRVINNKSTPSPNPSPNYGGHTIIVTLPHVENRFVIIGKIKRCLKGVQGNDSIYVDADLTPAEAQEHYNLRKERNKLNSERSDADNKTHHFGIRNGKIIKISH